MSTLYLDPCLTGGMDAYVLGAMSRLGNELRRLRKARGLRQIDVAKALGHADQTTVSTWERGKITPTAETYARLADVLGTTAAKLSAIERPHDPNAPRKGPDNGLTQAPSGPDDSTVKGGQSEPTWGGDAMFWKVLNKLDDDQQLQLLRMALRMLEANETAAQKGVG